MPVPHQAVEGLRILGLCDHFTESCVGGAEKVTIEVYRRLAAAGADVRVVSATPSEPPGTRLVAGIPTEYVPARDLSRRLRAQVTWAPAVWTAATNSLDRFRPDVVHATSLHFQSAVIGSIVARRRRVPVVTTGHVASIEQLPLPTRWATNAYEQTVGRRLVRSSTGVIAVSAAVAAHLEHLGAAPTRLSIVPNGVDLDRFRPGPAPRRPVVLFVGRLIANKGPDVALAAFARAGVRGAEFIVVGDGPMRGELEAQAQRLGVAASVRFLGRRSDVETVLASAAVLIRPSLTEGQSLAILEAMAVGTGVVASNIPANAELLDGGRAGALVACGDVDGFAQALRRLLHDGAWRADMVERARQIVVGQSWDACAERTGRVLATASTGDLVTVT